jgi:hypothetical protein
MSPGYKRIDISRSKSAASYAFIYQLSNAAKIGGENRRALRKCLNNRASKGLKPF